MHPTGSVRGFAARITPCFLTEALSNQADEENEIRADAER